MDSVYQAFFFPPQVKKKGGLGTRLVPTVLDCSIKSVQQISVQTTLLFYSTSYTLLTLYITSSIQLSITSISYQHYQHYTSTTLDILTTLLSLYQHYSPYCTIISW